MTQGSKKYSGPLLPGFLEEPFKQLSTTCCERPLLPCYSPSEVLGLLSLGLSSIPSLPPPPPAGALEQQRHT